MIFIELDKLVYWKSGALLWPTLCSRWYGMTSHSIVYAADIVSQKEQCDRMKAIETKTYSLLLEASRSFGFEFAFSEPMYFTWTLERFSKCLICLLCFALIIWPKAKLFPS